MMQSNFTSRGSSRYFASMTEVQYLRNGLIDFGQILLQIADNFILFFNKKEEFKKKSNFGKKSKC